MAETTAENIRRRIDVAELHWADLAEVPHGVVEIRSWRRLGGGGPTLGSAADEHERGLRLVHAREAPGAEQHSQPLLGGRPADEQELRRCAHRPCRVPGRFEPACSPEVVVDGLGSHVDVAGPACAYVGAHVRAVRDHGISRAVEAPQRQVAQHVGRAERVRPQRCPQDQRDPSAARPLPGGQGRQAAQLELPKGEFDLALFSWSL